MKKVYMHVIPLVVPIGRIVQAQIMAASLSQSVYNAGWNEYRRFINLSECEEMPGKRKRISVGVLPLEFDGYIMFDTEAYSGIAVGVRTYYQGEEYKSEYITQPVQVESNERLNLHLMLDEDD